MTFHKANGKPCSRRAESPGTSTCQLWCSCADEDLRLLLDKLNMSQESTLVAKEANGTLGLHWQECGQQVKGDVSLPLCSALLNPPRVLCSASSSVVEDINSLECIQQRATRIARGTWCNGRGWKNCAGSAWRQRDITSYQKATGRDIRGSPFLKLHNDRMRGK